MHQLPLIVGSRTGNTPPGELERLVSTLEGHKRAIHDLMNIQNIELAPYCALLIGRIKKKVIPVLEEAIVAAKILQVTNEPLPQVTVQNLQDRIQSGLMLPAYEGGD